MFGSNRAARFAAFLFGAGCGSYGTDVPDHPLSLHMTLSGGGTVIVVGTDYELRVTGTDRLGHLVSAAGTFTIDTEDIAFASPLGIIHAQSVGRTAVRVHAVGLVDTAFVSVVASATMFATRLAGSLHSLRASEASVSR